MILLKMIKDLQIHHLLNCFQKNLKLLSFHLHDQKASFGHHFEENYYKLNKSTDRSLSGLLALLH